MKTKQYTAEIISVLLILLWLSVAISKFFSLQTLHTQLSISPFTRDFGGVFITALGFTELMLCLMLFFGRFRKQGLVGSLILLSLYVVNTVLVIPIMGSPWMTLTDFLPALPWPVDGMLDVLFIALAAVGYWIMRNEEEDERILHALFREQIRATETDHQPYARSYNPGIFPADSMPDKEPQCVLLTQRGEVS